jgi:hypothetical protein
MDDVKGYPRRFVRRMLVFIACAALVSWVIDTLNARESRVDWMLYTVASIALLIAAVNLIAQFRDSSRGAR